MIFNSTYTDKEKELEVEKLIGKKYGIISSIRLNGVGSKRLIVQETSQNLKKIIIQKSDLIYSNIEIRPGGVIVYIAEGLNRYSWVIPYYKLVIYKTPNYSIHSEGDFIRFSNNVNVKENLKFFKKLLKHKILHNGQLNIK
ncbi:MAG: hypothetical protein ACJ0O0_03230 [Flavobacteriaceae bacterium]|nr:MAG: hypothetical protein DBW76_02005 [Bacteroidota bacterium]|tara:strand:- start:5823 stop:6245 length:423 start_codon:yes stop_codon:yes gene_type:complete